MNANCLFCQVFLFTVIYWCCRHNIVNEEVLLVRSTLTFDVTRCFWQDGIIYNTISTSHTLIIVNKKEKDKSLKTGSFIARILYLIWTDRSVYEWKKPQNNPLTFGLQLDMNGLTSHIEAVPQTERKAQAFNIQTTQSIFGSFCYKTSITYLQSIHSKRQCNLNVFKNSPNLIVLKHRNCSSTTY